MNEQGAGTAAWCSRCGATHLLTDPCPALQERTGTVLGGKYLLVRLIGEGGMGAVYEARHTVIGRRLAVKFLHGEFAQRSDVAKRFENEARAAGEVEHENIAGIYDVGALPDGTRYLVMEFLDGEDLEHVLKRERRLPFHRAADLLTQACQGLAVVHPRGIVHRDLKPANLFLTRRANDTEVVKILDFGIAKLRRPDGDSNATATETGAAIGTPIYMSPEQARGEPDIGARSDIYALGVILYELLSGRRPHEGTSALETLHQILTLPPTPLEEVCPELPGPVYGIVRKAMAARAADRFAGVSDLAQALAPFVGERYRSQVPALLAATHIEAPSDVRVRAEEPSQAISAPQSVVGVSRLAAPSRHKGVGLFVGACVALVAVGAGGTVAWTRLGKGTALPSPTAASSVWDAPLPTPLPVAVSPSGASLPATPPLTGGESPQDSASGRDLSGQERASGHPDDSSPPVESAKIRGPGAGPGLAQHSDVPPTAAHRPARGTPVPSSQVEPGGSKTSAKPDCAQTYTIDPEGNRIFRPECFRK